MVERYAVVLFDLDEFKSVNDLHGHPAGDLVLRSVTHAARAVVRRSDCLARIGGVTFARATFPDDGGDAEAVLTCADQRLLARKRESKQVAVG